MVLSPPGARAAAAWNGAWRTKIRSGWSSVLPASCFSPRFLVQWIASERARRRSCRWLLVVQPGGRSNVAGLWLWRRDPVFAVGRPGAVHLYPATSCADRRQAQGGACPMRSGFSVPLAMACLLLTAALAGAALLTPSTRPATPPSYGKCTSRATGWFRPRISPSTATSRRCCSGWSTLSGWSPASASSPPAWSGRCLGCGPVADIGAWLPVVVRHARRRRRCGAGAGRAGRLALSSSLTMFDVP